MPYLEISGRDSVIQALYGVIQTLMCPMANLHLQQLDSKLTELMELCSKLKLENRSLRNQQQTLVEERAKLIEKNELARTKVESMITRLKSMEASQ